MAWDPSRDPGWVRLQGTHPIPPGAQVPINNAMANLALYPGAFDLQASMSQYNWQGPNIPNSSFNPNILRPQDPFSPMDSTPYLAGARPIPQNATMTTGIGTESPVIAFGPGSPPPIVDPVTFVGPTNHGVIKIKNIPYGITMAEVQQFMLKQVTTSDILQPHRDGYPYHIIMERSTGKTMDVFIEVQTQDIAADAVDCNFRGMKLNRLGQRMVNLELSSQAQLLQDLFPRARSVVWDEDNNGAPYLVENTDPYSSGFNGLLTREELNGLIRHAETPGRSPFAQRSQQRPYESMISTLYKFPWYATDLYTMEERDGIYLCFMRQLKALVDKVDPLKQERREVGLDTKLLMEFVFAGMNCPAFSQRQKFSIVIMSAGPGRGVILSAHARAWPFQCLSPDPTKLSDQDIGMWLHIIQSGIEALIRDYQDIQNIGIEPHLGVEFVDDCFVVRATDSGMQLTRKAFATLEEKFLAQALKKGWAVYLGQYGLFVEEPNTLDDPFVDGNSITDNHLTSGQGDINGPGPAVVTDGRISTARRNSATELPRQTYMPSAAPTQSQDTTAWVGTPLYRPKQAIPITRPDGTVINFQHSETAVISERIGDKYDGSISITSDGSATVSPAGGLGCDSDQRRFPSGASSNYNFPVISRTTGSPVKGTPPGKPLTGNATKPSNLSPSRPLRRVSGTSVSPTKADRSVASFRTMGSSSRKSSWDILVGDSDLDNPRKPGTDYRSASTSSADTVVHDTRSSPGRPASTTSTGTVIYNNRSSPGRLASTSSIGPVAQNTRSSPSRPASASSTGTITNNNRFSPGEDSIAEEEDSETNYRSSSTSSSGTLVQNIWSSPSRSASAGTTGTVVHNRFSPGEDTIAEEEESGIDYRSASASSTGTVVHNSTISPAEDDIAEEEESGYIRGLFRARSRKGA